MPSPRPLLALALLPLAALSAFACRAASPDAEGFDVRTFTCPVGGATFKQDVGYSSLVLVQFADGSWLGDTGIDAQIPECPDNGLVILPDYGAIEGTQRMAYLAYTPAQVARLPELMASDAYRELRKRNRHERAQWLATQLELPADLRWKLLVRGSWATVDAADRKRFVARIAEEGPALVDAMDAPDMEKRAERLFIANALRELGRFDDALSLLEATFTTLPADADIKDPDTLSAIGTYGSALHDAITHRDDDRFPIGMSSEKWVSRACGGNMLPPPYGPETANAKAACERRTRERQVRDDAYDEARVLLASPETLDRQCAATPEDKRSSGLVEACRQVKSDRDREAGDALALEQPDKLAADCEATPAQDREGALFYGCISYRTALEWALSEQLVEDDEAYAIVCDDGESPPDRAAFADMACSSAEEERRDRAVEALMADTASLDGTCAGMSETGRPIELMLACSQRRRDVRDAEVARLADNQAAYDATCAQPSSTKSEDAERREDLCDDARQQRKYNEDNARLSASAPAEATTTSSPDSPERNIHARDSGLNKAARAGAARVIAKAKAERTYPKRQRGDLY